MRRPAMQLDPHAYLRLEMRRHSLGATSIRRVVRDLDRRHPRSHALRRRASSACALGPNTRPDYGLIVGRAQRCADDAARARACGRSPPAMPRSRSPAMPLRVRLLWKGAPVLDVDHRRALPRLHAPARRSAARRAAACGPRRSRSRRASRCTGSAKNSARSTSAASSSTRRSRTRSASTPGSRTRTRRSLEPGHRQRRVGHVRAHARHGDARRRAIPTGRIAATRSSSTTRRSISFLFAGDTTRRGIIDAYTAAHRAARPTCRAGASACGCRARTTRRRRRRSPSRASCASASIPCDVLTLDGRAAWNVETRFDFKWDPERFPIRARRSRAIKRARPARVRLGIPVRVGPLAAVPASSRIARYLLHDRRAATPTSSPGTPTPGVEPFGEVLTPLPDSGIVDFTNPAAFAWWRDAHEALFADGVDVIKSDFGEHVPDDARRIQRRPRPAPAQRLSAALQPLRLRGDARVQARMPARRSSGAARAGPGSQRYPMRLGRRSAERLGRPRRVDPRRTVVGHERQPVSRYRHRRLLRIDAAVAPSSIVRWLQATRVRVAHARARHRRARAVGVRRRGRGDRAQVARVPLSADSVSRARDRAGEPRPACP